MGASAESGSAAKRKSAEEAEKQRDTKSTGALVKTPCIGVPGMRVPKQEVCSDVAPSLRKGIYPSPG